ncbi:hypothetical protein [Halorientalis pallida]|uniref:JAB domain-containing protein n=1 Tax=Halorientalis pallida TaxID=2479928 RepID=A0A498L0F2_9EURY|nr:hypothetical protein [Halorientalis pallida]RXK51456.1 hypothetical protein EAF64_02125 [Halorientalis pallida]
MTGPSAWLATRTSERTLARLVLVFAAGFVVVGSGVAWYVGSVGLSMGAMAYDSDDRTVVIEESERAAFTTHYDEDDEVGWCLYGTSNETHVRIDDVVPAAPVSQGPERVTFTCLPETAGQLLAGENAALLGTVHSHPGHDESELSGIDIALFGRLSPLVKVMGVYTDADGPAFFTTGSMTNPLDVRVVGDAAEARWDRGQRNRSNRSLNGSAGPAVRDRPR